MSHSIFVPVPGAAAYRVEIASDADFLDLIGDRRESTPHASFENVPEGDDFVRVSATDADGIDGEQQVYTFERWLDRTHAVAARLEGNGYAFRWLTAEGTHFRFIPFGASGPADPTGRSDGCQRRASDRVGPAGRSLLLDCDRR